MKTSTSGTHGRSGPAASRRPERGLSPCARRGVRQPVVQEGQRLLPVPLVPAHEDVMHQPFVGALGAHRATGYGGLTRWRRQPGKEDVSSVPDSIKRGRGAISAPRSSCSSRPNWPKATWDPHMFHGILWHSAQDEEVPPAHDRGRHPVIQRRGEEGDRAAIGETDHAQTPRVDQRVVGQHVETPLQVPDVLGERVSTRPSRHGRGWCHRRSGRRDSSPAARRSSAGRAPAPRNPAAPIAGRSRCWANVGVGQADGLGLAGAVHP